MKEVKKLITAKLKAENAAVAYSEPEQEVISRSGDICVVSLVDQWYIDYAQQEWKEQVVK